LTLRTATVGAFIGESATGVTRLTDGDMEFPKPRVLLNLPAEVRTTWAEGKTKYEETAGV
jgi:hypothetical protein